MIKLEHTVLPSPEQMQFVIEGMRNPMNSWDKSDSVECAYSCSECYSDCTETDCKNKYWSIENFGLGKNDYDLMKRLAKAGTDHRKFMRMMPVYVRITAPLYWWKEFDTYKVGTVSNSCSTMHKITEKEFTLDDFSIEHLNSTSIIALENIITRLNNCRTFYLEGVGHAIAPKDKEIWWQLIQLLPSSYNQTRNIMLTYEVLANIYHSRKNHKLDEWVEFCRWLVSLPYSELIVMKD